MPVEKSLVQEVNQSLGRSLLHSGFLEKFYENFIAINPAIPPFFVKTDMAKQRKLLKDGLTYLIMAAGGSAFAQKEISRLGTKHDVKHLNIPPKLYGYWVDALMKSVKEFDQDFNADLEKKWRLVVQEGINTMASVHQAQKNSA